MRLAAFLLAFLSLGLAACGAGEEGAETAPAPAEESTTEPSELVSKDLDEKPRIEVPEAPPPPSLKIDDVVEGDGPAADAGDQLEVDYVGVAYSSGKEFDSSWGAKPFSFALGEGKVIPGWDQGLDGMRVGGRRVLTIPPELAYGTEGVPPDIGANETLIFVVDLLDVKD